MLVLRVLLHHCALSSKAAAAAGAHLERAPHWRPKRQHQHQRLVLCSARVLGSQRAPHASAPAAANAFPSRRHGHQHPHSLAHRCRRGARAARGLARRAQQAGGGGEGGAQGGQQGRGGQAGGGGGTEGGHHHFQIVVL